MNYPRPNADPKVSVPLEGNIPQTDAAAWWRHTSDKDCAAALEKAVEYGSADLDLMGVAMNNLIGEPGREFDERSGTEAAILFYILGKVARALSAVQRGALPSDDTWHDIVVYAMMARRIRQNGVWP